MQTKPYSVLQPFIHQTGTDQEVALHVSLSGCQEGFPYKAKPDGADPSSIHAGQSDCVYQSDNSPCSLTDNFMSKNHWYIWEMIALQRAFIVEKRT